MTIDEAISKLKQNNEHLKSLERSIERRLKWQLMSLVAVSAMFGALVALLVTREQPNVKGKPGGATDSPTSFRVVAASA